MLSKAEAYFDIQSFSTQDGTEVALSHFKSNQNRAGTTGGGRWFNHAAKIDLFFSKSHQRPGNEPAQIAHAQKLYMRPIIRFLRAGRERGLAIQSKQGLGIPTPIETGYGSGT